MVIIIVITHHRVRQAELRHQHVRQPEEEPAQVHRHVLQQRLQPSHQVEPEPVQGHASQAHQHQHVNPAHRHQHVHPAHQITVVEVVVEEVPAEAAEVIPEAAEVAVAVVAAVAVAAAEEDNCYSSTG